MEHQTVLTCRSKANYEACGKTPPATYALRNCDQCHQPVYLSDAGQQLVQEGRIRYILCCPCSLIQTTLLTQAGAQVSLEMGPAAAESIEQSEAAKRTANLFLDIVTGKKQ